MGDSSLIDVRVKSMTWLADEVLGIDLEALDGCDLPAANAGSHIDVKLSSTVSRSYSVVRCDGTPRRYQIAVAKDGNSRGGSKFIHESLRPGDVVQISAPRNFFPLAEDAKLSALIAGGIGITPLWSMVRQLDKLGRPWVLHYAARSRVNAAYLEDIDKFAACSVNGKVIVHFDDEHGGQRMDIAAIVREIPLDAHLYCCGPHPMLDAFESATADRPTENVHLERFSSDQPNVAVQTFTVVLAKSGQSFDIPPDRSILDVLLENGVDVPFGCMQGACGLCETRVVAGEPEHRDKLLSDEAKASGQTMLICCSRSATDELHLDV